MSSTLTADDSKAELASLQRVSHRLVITDDEKLTGILEKLLPRLLLCFRPEDASNSSSSSHGQQIHNTLVSILSHVMKRVKGNSQIKLPCPGILEQLVLLDDRDYAINHQVNVFGWNLSFLLLTLGHSRSSREELYQMLSRLVFLQQYFALRQAMLTDSVVKTQAIPTVHLLMQTLVRIYHLEKDITNKELGIVSTEELLQPMRLLLVEHKNARAALYDLFLDFLLYQIGRAHV